MNVLFDTEITGADVELCAGKRPVRMQDLGQKTVMLECWHTPSGTEDSLLGTFARLLRGTASEEVPGEWAKIAIRAALLIAGLGQLRRAGILTPGQRADYCAVSGSLGEVMSGWYVRQWGFPIGSVLCACNENSEMWDLIHQGCMKTDTTALPTKTPACDIPVPTGTERLVFACGGVQAVGEFLTCLRRGMPYVPPQETLEAMQRGLSVYVISASRMERIQRGVKSTTGYPLSDYDALCYGSMQDHRASGSENRICILLAQYGPENRQSDEQPEAYREGKETSHGAVRNR